MRIIDISWTISPKMTVYKNKKERRSDRIRTRDVKEGAEESLYLIDSHAGTHVDAPAHVIRNGKTTEKLILEKLFGTCKVLNMRACANKITATDLEKQNICEEDIVLLKTTNSDLAETEKFNEKFVYLDKSGADYLIKKKIKAVGIDYLSLERGGHEAHKALMKAEIPIIEGLRLREATPGPYDLACLPLRIKDGDAAPARAILIDHYN